MSQYQFIIAINTNSDDENAPDLLALLREQLEQSGPLAQHETIVYGVRESGYTRLDEGWLPV